jgi:hypothetical protein
LQGQENQGIARRRTFGTSYKRSRRLVRLRLVDADLPASGRDCGKGPFMDGNQIGEDTLSGLNMGVLIGETILSPVALDLSQTVLRLFRKGSVVH